MNERLLEVVAEQMGGQDVLEDYAQDIASHGADAGFPGFTYYSDTVSFYKANKTLIIEAAREMATELGAGTISEFVASFNCLRDYTPTEIEAFFIYDDEDGDNYTYIVNALSWFAMEESARAVCNAKESII